VALRRAQVARYAAPRRMPLNAAIEVRIAARLPFTLTPSQQRVFQEIARDMAAPHPMNRLLQGDVGSGKTAVAVSALLLCVAHGQQAVLLAPTEVLAEQHFRTLQKMLANSRVKISLLRGASTEKERTEVLADLASGAAHIAVGTHALLEPDVKFQSLSLVIVDEQHKFGVAQRMSLRQKGRSPHVLVMTATPIPRTLTLTLYGDLDVSRIDEPPPGRGEIVTKWITEAARADVYRLIVTEARKGHATYVVLPRIDEDTPLDDPPDDEPGKKPKKRPATKLWNEVKGAEAELKRLRAHLPTLRIDLLHGRMKGDEKDAVLTKLREGKIDVLVSTQVIEVGIDLPGATVMVIENAEMFGLSALHQLRGRVGRSELKSYCLFFANANNEEGEKRLKTFTATRDGFKIAEADFQLRGPGQFFGTAQSGMPELKVADLLRDEKILAEAREAAFDLVARDPQLAAPEHAALKRRLKEVLGGKLGLVDMG
jgi:ATP-dependent DNA helicase RecG